MIKEKAKCYQELYCPNPACPYHLMGADPKPHLSRSGFIEKFHRFGSFKIKKKKASNQEIPRQRYRCTLCGKTFAETFCSLEYRCQRRGFSPKIFELFARGLPNHQIALTLKLSESVVRYRLKRMAKQALLIHSAKTRRQKILEPVAYDGLQNFAKSQFEPNNINQAIGMNSLFIYDFNFSPLNRTGHMSDRQKLIKLRIEDEFGRFPQDAARTATKNILLRMVDKTPRKMRLALCTDQLRHYDKAIRIDLRALKKDQIDHFTINSKRARVFKHILHSVNHADGLIRHHIRAFSRETIAFSKTHIAMVDKYALFMAFKNYIRPQFTKVHKHNRKSNVQSPAMAVGLEKKLLTFRNFFRLRMQPTQVILNQDWKGFYNGQVGFARCFA